MSESPSAGHGHAEAHHKPTGIKRWLFTTDHKDIGLMYIWTAFFFFVLGGIMALLMRLELMFPNGGPACNPALDVPRCVMTASTFNQFFSMHGTTMIFLWTIPVLAGFGNYFVPLMIKAKDMAFPRLNALSYWLIPPAGLLIWAGAFLPDVNYADLGWTGYVPLSMMTKGIGIDMWILGLQLIGVASTLGAINFIATIFFMRGPGVTFTNMPLMVWAQLTTALLTFLATPVLGTALVMLYADRNFGTHFFNADLGGPILWQNLFWFYSHPAVYIMILPAMGIISEVLPKFSRRPIFGYKAIAYSTIAIGFLGFTVWAHHMFVTGIDPRVRTVFMINTMIIGVPTGVKIFNWIATVHGGKILLRTPMLFALGFVALFTIGGLDGVFLASIPVDYALTDTYWVVAHIHYVLFAGTVMGVMAGIYYWFPRMTGRMYNEFWGKVHFVLMFIGLNATFLVMHVMGTDGMPRRVYDYGEQYGWMNFLASLGAFTIGAAMLLFFTNMLWSMKNGPKVDSVPWDIDRGAEWESAMAPYRAPTGPPSSAPTSPGPLAAAGAPGEVVLVPEPARASDWGAGK
ncbi:MAG: cbb3-type cytochrome c oxidase subunit I [Euryarchaeota archaeon]|nr:cbb3-type cytochrome c oxidase subunit I [Euryarchaeota archaeon]